MIGGCRFAYAQARLQARYAELPTETDWRRLSGARQLSGWLEEARSGALKRWVKGFSAQSDSHDIERGVRAQFIETVEQVADFLPAPWHDAVAWCRWLPLLGLFDHVRGGGRLPAWALDDPRLRSLLGEDKAFDPSALADAGIDGLLADDASRQWLAQWRQSWPRCKPTYLAAVDALVLRGHQHLQQFREAPLDKAWTLRQLLRERLRLEFHLHLLQPASAFIFLSLVALDLERLRRALLDRQLFEVGLAATTPAGEVGRGTHPRADARPIRRAAA
ncbi:MAG: hypothetical protein WBM40_08805 [Thiohalocapsa sp.]